MTITAAHSGWRHPARAAVIVLVVAVASSVAFALVHPGVSDLWAARAREYAADHGVGLTYWFAWYGGTVPGHYSVLTPYVVQVVGSVGLIALAAAVTAALLLRLLDGTRHPALAMTAALIGLGCNLWSGRVAFLAGAVVAVLALLALRARHGVWAGVLTVVAGLVTPVAAAFVALGVVGTVVFDRDRRRAATAMIVLAVVTLGALGLAFGSPGPEGFRGRDLVLSLAATAVLLLLRPERPVLLVTALSLPVCLVAAEVPNGLGSNFERMVWFVLPVACVATARIRPVWLTLLAAFPLALGVAQTYRDIVVSQNPLVAPHAYRALDRRLDAITDLQDYRVEVVPTSTHADAYQLLGYAQQARGDETQSDKGLYDVITHAPLSATTYRRWLDDNAVGYVVSAKHNLKPHGPEATLVDDHRPGYLRPVWQNAQMTLYAVTDPTPIVPRPGRVIRANQASLVLQLRSGTQIVRVRWSHFLTLHDAPAGARLSRSDTGWLRVTLPSACTCTLTG